VSGVAGDPDGRGYRDNILADLDFFKRLAGRGTARFSFAEKPLRSDVRRADFSRRSGMTAAFFCLLALQKPKYIENGDPIPLEAYSTRANRKDRHHIFPVAQLRAKGFTRSQYNSLCNICFVVAEENQSIGQKKPVSYLSDVRRKRFFSRVMKSHLIPHHNDSGIWDFNVSRGYKKFVKQRLVVLCKAFEAQAGMKLFVED
jgi:hypothetical protein